MGNVQLVSETLLISHSFANALLDIMRPYARIQGEERIQSYRQMIERRDYRFANEADLRRYLSEAEGEQERGGALTVQSWMILDAYGNTHHHRTLDASRPLSVLTVLDIAKNGSFTVACGTNPFDVPNVSVQFRGARGLITIAADDLSFDALVVAVRRLVDRHSAD